MRTSLPLSLFAAFSITLSATAQIAYDYPTAVPAEGIYSFTYHDATLPVGSYSAAPPYDLVTGLTYANSSTLERGWIPSAGTPFAASAPQATNCSFTVLSDPNATVYYYTLVASTGVQVVGQGSVNSGYSAFTDVWDALIFPSYVASGYNDNYVVNGNTYQGITNPLSKGTLTTPYGTYDNVVLIERGINNGLGTTFTYNWYSDNNLAMPLATYSMDSEHLELYTPEDFSPLAVPEASRPAMRLWPNPCSTGEVRLNGLATSVEAQLLITASDGRAVLDRAITTGGDGYTSVDVHELSAGMYPMEVRMKDGTVLRERLVVVR